MMENIAIPALNPADTGSEAGVLEFVQKKILSRIEKVAPAKVVSYDRVQNRAVVQILPQEITSTGGKLQRRQMVNIPVLTLSGGGFWLGFPLQPGDVGWIIAADRDISVFKQQLSEYAPNTYRKHKYDDSFFVPDRVNNYTIAEEDSGAVLISSVDGATKVSIKGGQVTVTAANTVINAANATINAATTVNGDVTVNGTVTVSGDVVGGGISLTGHVHGGVMGGSGTTGAPQ